MKRNFLTPVLENKVVSSVTNFCSDHKSALLAGSTIGFSLTTTAMVFRNSPMIHQIIWDTRDALDAANSEEEKKSIYGSAFKELVPLVGPIIFFQAGVIATAIIAKKDSDKKDVRIAELTSAAAVASQVIEEYRQFQKDTEQALGEKKYEKLQNDIYKDKDIDGRRFTSIASEGAPGEILMIDKYSGRPFWSTPERVESAAREIGRMLSERGGYEQVSINDYYDMIGNNDLTPNELGERFGYICEYQSEVDAHFADTHFIFPNGTRIPAFMAYLSPEPDYIG